MGDYDEICDNEQMPPETCWDKTKHFLSLITVEPTMLLYMMAFMTTSVVEQQLFIDKACRVNHNLNETVCAHITDEQYKDLNKQVQVTVSEFHQWNDIAGHTGPIILAMFMGSWSDRRGRKLPLLLGLTGKFYYSAMVVLNTLQNTWPVEYIIYTATLPSAFTGADVAIFAAAFTYISDITSQESRTLRVTVLEVVYLATMPTGIALGSFLFTKVTNRSYTTMFIINSSLLAMAIIYAFVRLKWRTSEKQRPLSEANNIFLDFFDFEHVVQTFKTLFKHRPMKRRRYLLLFIVAMGCYTFQRDEKPMSYLYLQLVLKWTFEQFSNFKTYMSALQDVVLLTAIPLMSKWLGFRDTVIIMVGALAHTVARIFYATAETGWIIYIGGTFAAIGPIVAPVIRSMMSKIVSAAERGKAFSVLGVADNAIPILSGVLYTQVYKATIHTMPSGIYYLTMATQMTVFLIVVYIHFTAKDHTLIHEDEEESSIENDYGTNTNKT